MTEEENDRTPVVKNRYSKSHPFMATIDVDGTKWHQFERMLDNDPIAVLLRADPENGVIKATIAALNEDTATMIEEYWGC